LEPNSDGRQIYKEISPDENEKVISKNYNSAFKDTDLREYLNVKA
jgi:nicotinamidase-related amidase